MTETASGPRHANEIRVLHVVDGLQIGGAQSLVYAQARLARQTGVRIAVAGIDRSPDAGIAELLESAADRFDLVRHARLWDPRGVLALAHVIRGWGAHVVHTHLSAADVLGGLAGRVTGRPVVATLHAVAAGRDQYRPTRRFAADFATRRLARLLVAVSDATRDSHVALLGLPPTRFRVVRNVPVAPLLLPATYNRDEKRASLGLGPDDRVAVTIARHHPQKDHPTTLRGMASLLHDGSCTTLLLVGDGETRPRLERLAFDLGLADRVRFLGNRSDAVEITAAADVVCQLTRDQEGIPVALLDAMSLGRAVVATAAPGIDEVVEEGTSAVLVPQGDAEAFARVVRRLLAEPALRAALGAGARAAIERRFSPERWACDLAAVYAEALGRGADPRRMLG